MRVIQRLQGGWQSWRDGMDGAGLLAMAGLAIGAIVVGYVCVMLGGAAVGKPVMLAVLPMLLLTGFLFVYSREAFLLVVILVRAGANPIFEETRMAAIGGLGGLLNALVILLAILIIARDPKRIPKQAWWVWAPLMVIMAFGLGYSPDPVKALRLYLGYLSVTALFLVSFHLVLDEHDLNKMLRLISWSSLPVALVTLAYIAMGKTAGQVDGLELSGAGRYGGPFTHANLLAFYLVLVIGIIFYRFKSEQIGRSFLTGTAVVAYMLLLLGLLYATKTRSAWISVLVLFVVYALLRERRYLVYLAIGGVLAMMVPEFRERVMGLTEGNQVVQYAKLNSFAWRKLLWADALAWMSPKRYVMGYGSESFFLNSTTFFSMSGGRAFGAHSAVVQMFFELGVIGLCAFLWVFLSTARMLGRLLRVRPLLGLMGLTLLAANFLVSLSDNMLAYLIYNWYFWLTMGLMCALAMRLCPDEAPGQYKKVWGIKARPPRQGSPRPGPARPAAAAGPSLRPAAATAARAALRGRPS